MGMTNEEREKHIRIASMLIGAIHDLIRPILMYQIEKDVTREALENYIKMLESQPCEDAEKYGMNEQMKSSSEKPNKSEIPTDWIPVSERLPEEDGEYLLFGKVTDEDENCIFIGEYDACAEKFGIWQELFDRDTLGCLDSDFYEYESVKAWMYLPSK